MNAELKQLLRERKSAIVNAWHEAVLAAPAGSSPDFAEKQLSLLAGARYSDLEAGLNALFDALLLGVLDEDTSRFLDSIVGIRATSAIAASHSLKFFIALKKAVRSELGSTIVNDPRWSEELTAWDAVIDDMVLFAFDRYAEHRENVFELNAEEERKRTFRLLRKAGLISDEGE